MYDAIYIPRNSDIEVACAATCDLAEVSAPVDHDYPLQFVPYADVERDPGLHFPAGDEGYSRVVNILIGKNVQAGRIVAGVTFSKPGNWTSWPPHEHAATLEEAYLYIAMPAPAWGMQFVYTDPKSPELAVVVREGDCVVMPKGYHPNVAAPGRLDQLPLDDGRPPRSDRPPVRRSQRAARVRHRRLRTRSWKVTKWAVVVSVRVCLRLSRRSLFS